MHIEITLKNYRCFPDSNPARMSVRGGFTSFIGVNNSGKSSLLKFFFEFRSLFQSWVPHSMVIQTVLQETPQAFGFPPTILDLAEVFCNEDGNTRDIQIEIKLPDASGSSQSANCPLVNRVVVTVVRPTNTFRAEAFVGDSKVSGSGVTLAGPGGESLRTFMRSLTVNARTPDKHCPPTDKASSRPVEGPTSPARSWTGVHWRTTCRTQP